MLVEAVSRDIFQICFQAMYTPGARSWAYIQSMTFILNLHHRLFLFLLFSCTTVGKHSMPNVLGVQIQQFLDHCYQRGTFIISLFEKQMHASLSSLLCLGKWYLTTRNRPIRDPDWSKLDYNWQQAFNDHTFCTENGWKIVKLCMNIWLLNAGTQKS